MFNGIVIGLIGSLLNLTLIYMFFIAWPRRLRWVSQERGKFFDKYFSGYAIWHIMRDENFNTRVLSYDDIIGSYRRWFYRFWTRDPLKLVVNKQLYKEIMEFES